MRTAVNIEAPGIRLNLSCVYIHVNIKSRRRGVFVKNIFILSRCCCCCCCSKNSYIRRIFIHHRLWGGYRTNGKKIYIYIKTEEKKFTRGKL